MGYYREWTNQARKPKTTPLGSMVCAGLAAIGCVALIVAGFVAWGIILGVIDGLHGILALLGGGQ